MKSIEVHSVVSFSKGKTRAQVIVLVGKGRNQRSVARHVVKQGYDWVGNNTDERAPELNSRCEAELATAESNLRTADGSLKMIQKKLEGENALTPEDILRIYSVTDGAEKVKEMLNEQIEMAQDAVYGAEMALEDAKDALAHVQRECPRQCEFTGVI